MPFEHPTPKHGLCPYCYEGELALDLDTLRIFCMTCKYMVDVPIKTYDERKKKEYREIPYYTILEETFWKITMDRESREKANLQLKPKIYL